MKKDIYKSIIRDGQRRMIKLAQEQKSMWYFNLHIKIVVESAQELLKLYKANEEIVLISAWLHDLSRFEQFKKADVDTHHIDSADMVKQFLQNYKITVDEKEKIVNCVLRHHNYPEYEAKSIEEQILVASDIISHFNSVYYFAYFKFNPLATVSDMAFDQLGKIEEDWQKLEMLPKAKKLVKDNYLFLKEVCNSED